MFNRRGFIELRTIVALLITLSVLPIAVYSFSSIVNIKYEYDMVNDELSLYQLRRIMLIAYDVTNNINSLDFIYHNDNYSLRLINNRLVLEPGYQMFLDNVDYLEFIEEGNAVLIRYEKHNKEYKAPIVKQNGIYLNDFLDNNDELSELDYSVE